MLMPNSGVTCWLAWDMRGNQLFAGDRVRDGRGNLYTVRGVGPNNEVEVYGRHGRVRAVDLELIARIR